MNTILVNSEKAQDYLSQVKVNDFVKIRFNSNFDKVALLHNRHIIGYLTRDAAKELFFTKDYLVRIVDLIGNYPNTQVKVFIKEKEKNKEQFFSKIAGITFTNAQDYILNKNLSEGDNLQVKFEQENEYDPNAIALFHKNEKLGYIPAHLAKDLHPYDKISVSINNITGEYPKHGINLFIEVQKGINPKEKVNYINSIEKDDEGFINLNNYKRGVYV